MCKCNPQIRTPYCGAIGCEWPEEKISEVKLPECPAYVSHPQSVWFEEHWRPLLQAKDAEIELVRNAYNMEKQELLNKCESAEFHADHYRGQLERLKNELTEKDAVLADIAKQGYGYQGYYEEEDYKGLAEHATKEHLRNKEKAREVLQKYRGVK